jgi:hypothetical protein
LDGISKRPQQFDLDGHESLNFQGNVENTTPSTFTSGGSPSISDFYALVPASGSGNYLGYFSLTTSGALTFNAGTGASLMDSPTI